VDVLDDIQGDEEVLDALAFDEKGLNLRHSAS
jgi:hypothetical protein